MKNTETIYNIFDEYMVNNRRKTNMDKYQGTTPFERMNINRK